MSNETILNAASIFFTEANFLQLAADLKSHTDGDSYTELMNKWVELVHDPRANYTDVENQEACLVAWDYMTDLSRVAKYQAQYFDEQELMVILAGHMSNKFQNYITPDTIRVFVDREAAKIENKVVTSDQKELYIFRVKDEILAAMDAKIAESTQPEVIDRQVTDVTSSTNQNLESLINQFIQNWPAIMHSQGRATRDMVEHLLKDFAQVGDIDLTALRNNITAINNVIDGDETQEGFQAFKKVLQDILDLTARVSKLEDDYSTLTQRVNDNHNQLSTQKLDTSVMVNALNNFSNALISGHNPFVLGLHKGVVPNEIEYGTIDTVNLSGNSQGGVI